MLAIVSCALHFGRNPYEIGSNSSSHSSSNAFLSIFFYTLSLTARMPNGHSLPLFFEMYIHFTDFRRCIRILWCLIRLNSLTLDFGISTRFPSIPTVRLPWFICVTLLIDNNMFALLWSISLCNLCTFLLFFSCLTQKFVVVTSLHTFRWV